MSFLYYQYFLYRYIHFCSICIKSEFSLLILSPSFLHRNQSRGQVDCDCGPSEPASYSRHLWASENPGAVLETDGASQSQNRFLRHHLGFSAGGECLLCISVGLEIVKLGAFKGKWKILMREILFISVTNRK